MRDLMTKLKELFPNSNININEIDILIESGILHENHEIEITDIDNYITGKSKTAKKKEKRKQNMKIVSELVSFLNSGRGVGLLFLGLAEINGRIIKKGVKSLKNKEQIRSIIYSNIGSIPQNIKNFKLDVFSIEYNDSNIFIIEVENNDLDCVFYSKIENIAFERQGDECKSINLLDFLEILAKKNHARVFVSFNKKQITEDKYILDVIQYNEGLEPGMYLTTKLSFSSLEKIEFSASHVINKWKDHIIEIKDHKIFEDGKVIAENASGPFTLRSHDNSKKVEGEKIFKSVFFGHSAYPPNSILAYPGMSPILGTLKIEKKDFEIFIDVEVFERKGKTQQEFFLKSKDSEIELIETYKSFKPYLQI